MSPSQFKTLDVNRHDDRVVVTLDRPEQRNAINRAMVDELHAVCGELERSPQLLVITGGDDGVFAAGADIGELRERRREEALAGVNLRLFERIRALPMPTLAAVDGHALGGGAELAWACDIRLASDRSVFGQPEPRLGIIAGAGAAWRLGQLVGESVAKQILLGGMTLNAEQAKAHGLVMDVCPPEQLLARTAELGDTMLKNSSIALRLTKMAVDSPVEAHPQVDLLAQAVLFEDEEKMRRMQKFLDRRR